MSKRSRQQLAFWLGAAGVLAIAWCTPFHAQAQTVWHVDDDAPLGGDGAAWNTAFKYLQDALEVASSGDEVRVAGGTYKPDQDEPDPNTATPGDREVTFQLISGVGLYGGYAGLDDPADPNDRDPNTYVSHLSGDLDGDEDPGQSSFHGDTENSYHVVTGSFVTASAVLDGFTIIFGSANGAGDNRSGAGMFNDTGNPTVHNCVFRLDYAVGSTFDDPAGGREGGAGMYNRSSSPQVTDCLFVDNEVSSGYGGGMQNREYSDPNVVDCSFVRNEAGSQSGTYDTGGAGMYNRQSSPTVQDCIFEENQSGHSGGARDPHDGGAIRNDGASNPSITNCIFAHNSAASGNGGAIANWDDSSPSVKYCTFADNSADSGQAIYRTGSAVVTITGCILWDGGDEIVPDESPAVTVTYSDVQGGWEGPGHDNINADPLLVDPDNGNYYLLSGSPCIDVAGPEDYPPYDIEGTPRPLDGDGDQVAVADMGAYEFDPDGPPRICVTPTQIVFCSSYEGGPNPDGQTLSIYNCGGGVLDWQIVEACDWLSTDPSSGQSAGEVDQVTLSVDIWELAPDQYECTLDVVDPEAPNSPQSVQVTLHVGEVWYVDDDNCPGPGSGTPADPFCTIQDGVDAAQSFDTVLVRDGTYTGEGNYGIRFYGKDVTVLSQNGPADCTIDCWHETLPRRAFNLVDHDSGCAVIDGFTVVNGDEGYGAAIRCEHSSPTIRNCVFTDNSATYSGGAIYYSLDDGDSVAVLNCEFIDNQAQSGNHYYGGGGVYCKCSDGASVAIEVTNCIFDGNSAHWGGGLAVWYPTATVTNCAFLNNEADPTDEGVGGGIWVCDSSGTTITNCSFSKNHAAPTTQYIFDGGAIFCYDCLDPLAKITNCIVWDNLPQDDQINYNGDGEQESARPEVNYCDVELGWPWPGTTGNIDEDPVFMNPASDLRLQISSPCIDVADNSVVFLDTDLGGNPRVKRCRVDMGAYEWGCKADLNGDGDTDLSDLAQLLGHYGTTSGATFEDGDVYACDGAVDLSDLAELVGDYGCGVGGGDGRGGEGRDRGPGSSPVTITVEAYNTHGYTGGGFNGEVDHFVFDLKIEVDDPNNDDWLVNGAVLDAENDATFRLSSSATTPDTYATFVAAPWTRVPESATATVAGAYDPPDPDEVFTTTEVNLGWYDTDTDSDDGPAAVMRLVIDVSEVDGADVSKGFGSVYFSTSGPAEQGDILVAELASETGTVETLPGMGSLSGNFYVKGE